MDGFVDVTAMLRPGVYLLWRRGKVIYVGQSRCPLVRIYTHRSLGRKTLPWISVRGMVFDAVSVLPTRLEELNAVEQRWIAYYAPEYNIRHKPSANLTTILPYLAQPKPPVVTRRI